MVHGDIGVLHHLNPVAAIVGKHRDADGGRCAQTMRPHRNRLGHRRDDLVENHHHVTGFGEIADHHHELVAAQPGDDIGFPDTRLKPTGHLDQQFIAHRVPQGIVDRLEAVQVEE
jgi:hypothetical protein